MALIKGREIVFKGFESGIFLKLKASEQSSDLNDTDNNSNEKRNRTQNINF